MARGREERRIGNTGGWEEREKKNESKAWERKEKGEEGGRETKLESPYPGSLQQYHYLGAMPTTIISCAKYSREDCVSVEAV